MSSSTLPDGMSPPSAPRRSGWSIRFSWVADRARSRLTGGRLGLSRPKRDR